MAEIHIEYLGFITQGTQREYTLRLRRPGTEDQDFVLAVPLEAFLTKRARFQDAPDICFRKLHRALAASPESLPPLFQSVSDAELAEYTLATAPKAPTRRPKPPVPAQAPAVDPGFPGFPPRRPWS
jgi:hypothetical protein